MDGWEPPPTSSNGKKRVCIKLTKIFPFAIKCVVVNSIFRKTFSYLYLIISEIIFLFPIPMQNCTNLPISGRNQQVRWADIEEKREQDKQRAIGFVVGQTNWNNLIDKPSNERDTKNALTQIKYIEKVNKNLK